MSISAHSSFKSNKKEAEGKAKELENDAGIRTLTAEELAAVKHIYHISPESDTVIPIEGELISNSLQVNGITTETIYQLNGVRVQLEPEAVAFSQEYNIAHGIYHEQRLYLIGLNEYSLQDHIQLIEERKQREEEAAYQERVKIMPPEQAVIRPLEVLSLRPASDLETEMLRSRPSLWLCLSVLSLTAILVITFLSNHALIWASATTLLGLVLLYWLFNKQSKWPKQPLEISRMRGQIDTINAPDDENKPWQVSFFKTDSTTQLTGDIPRSAADMLKRGQVYEFEMYKKTHRIVSIRSIYTLEEEARHTPISKKLHGALALGWFMAALLTTTVMNVNETTAAFFTLFDREPIHITQVDDFNHTDLHLGTLISLSGYRYCHLGDEYNQHEPYAPYMGDSFCKKFVYADHPIDYSAHPFTTEYSDIIREYNQLDFLPQPPSAFYLQMQLIALINKKQLAPQNTLVFLTQDDLVPMARFIDKYCNQLEQCDAARKELLQLWQKMTDQTCEKNCWTNLYKLPANKSDQKYLIRKEYVMRNSMYHLLHLMNSINKTLRQDVQNYINDFDGHTWVRLTHAEPQKSTTLRETIDTFMVNEKHVSYTSLLNLLDKEQTVETIRGHLTSVSRKDNHLYLDIDLDLTAARISDDLNRLAIFALFLLCMIVHGLIYARRKIKPEMIADLNARTKRAYVW